MKTIQARSRIGHTKRRHEFAVLGYATLIMTTVGSGIAAPANATTLHAVSPQAAYVCKPDATRVSFWAWAYQPDIITAFNRTHPRICVVMDDNGASSTEYTKIDDALKAGSGAPDVAEVEYYALPSFEITHSLANLVSYGADGLKSHFVPLAWGAVSQGSSVYAVPVDIGALAFEYNSALFSKYDLAVPTTWAQFASESATLKKDDPNAYLTELDWADPQPVLAMMEQFDAFPFQYSGGSKLGINLTGPAEMNFANYWQGLISTHETGSKVDFAASEVDGWANGTDLSYIAAAFGTPYLGRSLTKTLGDWRVAPMPQLKSGDTFEGNFGGSSIAVLASSRHPEQAAQFAEWFGGSSLAWSFLSTPAYGAFPSYKPELDNPSFLSGTEPGTAPQHWRTVFAQAANRMKNLPLFPPIMGYVITLWPTVFAGVANGTETLPDAFRTMQSDLVTYAKGQGFSITR